MTPAILSLLALVVALALSMTSRINVGLLAVALAWVIGVYAAGLKPDVVMAGFPITLFLTLTGVTLLFTVTPVVAVSSATVLVRPMMPCLAAT